MKHIAKKSAAILLSVLLTVMALMLCASAAFDHQPYYALQTAYNTALSKGDSNAIAAACEDILAFYSDLPDKTACDRVVTPIQKMIAIYEAQGKFDDVMRLYRENLRVYQRKCELNGTKPDPHKPYDVLQKAYTIALSKGDSNAIAAACEDIIAFYGDFADKTACDRVFTPLQKATKIYLEQRRFDDVLRLHKVEQRYYRRNSELTGKQFDPHQPYWTLQSAYNAALATEDPNTITMVCEALIVFYSDLSDMTACDRVTTPILKAITIYESQGRFDDVRRIQKEFDRTYLRLCELSKESDPHRPYNMLQKIYNQAVASGDPDAIAAACEDIITFYHDLWDKTACDRLTTPIQKAIAVYETQGKYDDVLRLYRENLRVYQRKCELNGEKPDPHKPYDVLQKAYNYALKSEDPNAIAAACEDIIAFYHELWDETACNRVATPIQKALAIYEEQGKYDDVRRLKQEDQRVYLRKCELTGVEPDPHRPYWDLQKAYEKAVDSGDPNAIAAECENILAFYHDLWDVTACDRVFTPIEKALAIYEAQGRFDDVTRLQNEDQRVYLRKCELTGEAVDPHRPYDKVLQKAYNAALKSEDPNAIAAACEDILAFYHDLWDMKACDRVVTPILKAAKIYEEQGRFDDALRLYREYRRCYLRQGELSDRDVDEPLKYANALIDAYAYTDPEIYVYANEPADVPDYGAKNEPHAGTYVGMCGYYEKGLTNAHLLYVQFENEYAQWFSYLLPKTNDYRLQEVAWNIPAEYTGDSVDDITKYLDNGAIEYFTKIADGSFDAYIIENLTYLATLENCGVLLRFAAEINVWGANSIYAENGRLEEFTAAFKAAFRRIHDLAEIHAPNVAMVYSPNDISNMYVSHEDFYPGDDCVDWIGMSAYGNRAAECVGTFGSMSDAYSKSGMYTNQMVKIKSIVDTYGDRKPIMISECGFMYASDKSQQDEQYARERMEYFYSYINMLYPQVKAIFYFNTNIADTELKTNYYCLFGEKEHSENLAAVYRDLMEQNRTISATLDGKSGGYTRLSTLCEERNDLTLSLYAAFPGNPSMTVTYTLDGKQLAQTAAAPYTVHIGAELLQEGRHTLSVKLQAQKTTVIEDYILYVSSDGIIRTEEPDMTDIPQNTHWAYPYVAYCMQEGFFDGLVTDAFEPTKSVTRADFVMLLGRAAGIDPADYSAPEFSDVPSNAAYAPYVSWAKESGVTQGTGEGLFSPNATISREQICTMLVRYCDNVGIALPEADGTKFADDREIDSWAQDGVYRAKAAGIVQGKGNNNFDPNGLLTRQEIAVILKNFHLGFIRAN